MPVSMEFLRGVLGVFGLLFAHKSGRAWMAARKGRQPISRFYRHLIRAVICLAALAFRHDVDTIAMGVWAMGAVAFAAGLWDVSRERKQEDLTREIFPDDQ